MKMRSLEYFVALAQAGSISGAARQLYVAQPSLTKALQQMEEELGVQLVVRSSGGIRLTEAGETVLREAQEVLRYYEGWKELGRQEALEQIDIYTYISFPDFLVPDIILRFRKKYPGLTINFTTSKSPEEYISRSVRRPVIALVMGSEDATLQELAQVQGNGPTILMRGEYRCLVSAQHPLAQQQSVTMQQLKKYYLILPNFDTPGGALPHFQAEILNNLLEREPDQPRLEVQTVENVIALVEKDTECYALSYYPAARRYPGVEEKRLIGVPIQDTYVRGKLALFYARRAADRHPVVAELVQAIQTEARRFLAEHGGSATL